MAEEQSKRRRRSGWDSTPAPADSITPAAQLVQPHFSLPITSGAHATLPNIAALGLPAIQLGNQLQLGHASISVAAQSTSAQNYNLDRRIYVGSLHYDLGQAEVTALFSCFGAIERVDMSYDPLTNRSKGFCFIEFADPASAQAATAMDGFELANRKIKVGRPHGGPNGQPIAGITPQQQAMQQAAMMALGMGGMMSQAAQLTQLTAPLGHSLGNVNIPPSTFSQQGLGQPLPTIHTGPSLSAAPPSPSTSTPLTAAQQSAKDRAQALLNKLGQSVGLLPVPNKSNGNLSRTVVIRNLRSEVEISEITTIFSPFGKIISCHNTGDKYTMISALGVPATVKAVQIEYEKSSEAFEALSMNDSKLAGLVLKVELLPTPTDPPRGSVSDTTSSTVESGAADSSASADAVNLVSVKNASSSSTIPSSKSQLICAAGVDTSAAAATSTVLLENLVSEYGEVFEDDFVEDIAEEAGSHGRLEHVQVRIRDIDVTKMDLKTFQNAIRTPDSIAPIEYAEVKVFLYYHEKTSAIKACQAMNGRFFAGKTIKATLVEQR